MTVRIEPYNMETVEQIMADTPMYRPDYIINDICNMEMLTTSEFTACHVYDLQTALIALGNIALGLILGYVFARGVFDVWR